MSALSLFDHANETSGGDDVAPTDHVESASSRSLYRKYRPQSLDNNDLVGQEHIVRTIRNAIRLDRVGHAYLFCGPRGTGKTTTARLLAKAVNCLDPDPDSRPCNTCPACLAVTNGTTTDIVEIDAASNRGIDDIRDLRERVRYAPTQLRSKFYIVDEAHQITGAAANAFLKTLEEPPGHARFVLATTDPEELLPTIVSRCQRFDFRRIANSAMLSRLRSVADREQIPITDDALVEIARHATGSLRDALGLLEQLALQGSEDGATTTIGIEDVRVLLGISRNERIEALLKALLDREVGAALSVVNEAVDAGEDARQLNRQLVAALREQLLESGKPRNSSEETNERDRVPGFDLARLAELLRRFSEVDYRIRHSPYAHLPLEIALVESIVTTSGRTAEARLAPPAAHLSEVPRRDDRNPDLPAPSTRLRDRVRGTQTAVQPASGALSNVTPPKPGEADPLPLRSPQNSTAAASEVSQQQPAHSEPPVSSNGSSSGTAANLDVERLADLWPRIRQEVKALNRRVEALLSSFDPAIVAGDTVVIATPYEFHRDKLNNDDVRVVVEQVVSRLVGRTVTVEGILVSDVQRRKGVSPPAGPASSNGSPSGVGDPKSDRPPVDDPADELHDLRVQSAKNIFDAEEIDG